MEIAPELAAVLHQQTQHQQEMLTCLEQILHTLVALTERVHRVEDTLHALLDAEEVSDDD